MIYVRGRDSFGKNGSKQGFSQKKACLKTVFLRDINLNLLTLEGDWTQKMLESRSEDALVLLVKLVKSTVETVETVENVETVETVETVGTVESVETVETVENAETIETAETAETVLTEDLKKYRSLTDLVTT